MIRAKTFALTLLSLFAALSSALPPIVPILEKELEPKIDRPVQEPKPIPIENELKILKAGTTERNGDQITLIGGVEIEFRDLKITADRIEGLFSEKLFKLFGKVQVTGEDINYVGGDVDIDLETRTMRFVNSRTTLGQKQLGEQIVGNLFLTAQEGFGGQRRYLFTHSESTTCDLEHPHYSITADKVEVVTGESITFRNASLEILGRRVLSLPFIRLPLNRELPGYLPEIGSSADEGFFVKARIGLDTRKTDRLDLLTDLMTRKGLGLGIDYENSRPKSKTSYRLYKVFGVDDTLVLNANQQQTLSSRQNYQASINYSKQNHLFSAQNTNLSIRTLAQLDTGIRLIYNRNASYSGTFETATDNLALNLTKQLKRTQVSVNGNLISSLSQSTSSASSFRSERRVFDLQARSSTELGKVRAELLYNRQIPISSIQNFFSSADQTPVISLISDTKRLVGLSTSLPLKFSYGNLIDPTRRRAVSRWQFETSLPSTQTRQGRTSLSSSGRFRQSLYSDDTAQFLFGYDASLGYEFKKATSFNLRYNQSRPQGFSPLAIDRSGRVDIATMDLTARTGRQFSAGVSTGYEFLEDRQLATPWQTVSVRTDWTPSNALGVKTAFTYDTFNGLWSNIRTDINASLLGAKFRAAVRYDGGRHTFGAASFFGEGLSWGKLGTGFGLNFNGYTKRFDSRVFNFTYDLHDSEMILQILDNQTGFRSGTTVSFFLRIKALPFMPGFGSGTQGQGLSNVGGTRF